MTSIDPIAAALVVIGHLDALWYRQGVQVSDRQWHDILAIITVQGPKLDHAYLEDGARVLGVMELLSRALHKAHQG
jgi:hypothetical protein